MFPDLRTNAVALEEAYQRLNLELSEVETDTGAIIYELKAPDDPRESV
jgi:hypothetical protein